MSCNENSTTRGKKLLKGDSKTKEGILIKQNTLIDSSNDYYTKEKSNEITLFPFSEIPKEIGAPMEVYFLSNKDKKEGRFIYVENGSTLGCICINNKMEFFNIDTFHTRKNITFSSNETYLLMVEDLKMKRNKSYDETFDIFGIIKLIKNGDTLLQAKVIGYFFGG